MESDMKTVYEFDTSSRLCPYTGSTEVAVDAKLADNQTAIKPAGMYWNGSAWTNETIGVWKIDTSGVWTGDFEIIAKGSTVNSNEVTVKPEHDGTGFYEARWDSAQQKWVENKTQDEINAYNAKFTQSAQTADQQDIAQLQQQMAQVQKENDQLKQATNYLGQEVSALKGKLEAQSATDTTEKSETESEA